MGGRGQWGSGKGEVGDWGLGGKSEEGGQMFLLRLAYVGLGRRLVFGRPCPPFMLS